MENKPTAKAWRMKPLLYSFAALFVIATATVAPRLLLQAGQRALSGGFYTMEARGGTLSYDDSYYLAGAVIRYAYRDGLAYWEEEYWTDEYDLCNEIMVKQVRMLAQEGVIPEEFGMFIEEYDAIYGGLEYGIRYVEDVENYNFTELAVYGWVTSPNGRPFETVVCSLLIEDETNKVISFSITLPYAVGEIEELHYSYPIDLLAYGQRFISWMELDGVAFETGEPWGYDEESEWSGSVEYYSSEANLRFSVYVGYSGYTNQSHFSISTQPYRY